MLCYGEGLLSSLTALMVLTLALSRSPALACLLPAGLYLALHLLALEPAAPQSAQCVLRPRGAPVRIAHRGGAHDAPENTLGAIRQEGICPSEQLVVLARHSSVFLKSSWERSRKKVYEMFQGSLAASCSLIRPLLREEQGFAIHLLLAIHVAAENGAMCVELDLEFSADGVPILMHDDTVERTTDGAGRLRDLTFEEIRKLNPAAKHRLRSQFQDEKVPTLREAVVKSMHHNLTIYFDVKGHANQAVDALKQLYQEFPQLYNSSVVCSFMPDVVYKMRQADRNVVTALTFRPWQLSHLGDGTPRFSSSWKHFLYMVLDVILDWSLHSFLWRLCGVSAFLIQKNFVSQAYVRHWSSRGIQVIVWTVNTFAEKSYYESVLDCSYITDSLVEDCDPHY